MNDDWSYAHMSEVWAETGHLRYDGWIQAFSIPQLAWGAAVTKIFGFSFSEVRASMLPLAIGCAVLMYLLTRWTGASRSAAALASLSLTLSPLYVPVATCFMSDVPGLFLFLLTSYCMLRAAKAQRQSVIPWLCAGALAGLVAGEERQIYWGAPLLMLAAFLFLRRRDRKQAMAAIALSVAVVLGIAASYFWFHAQPQTRAEGGPMPLLLEDHRLFAKNLMFTVLTVAAFSLPALMRLLAIQGKWLRVVYGVVATSGCLIFRPSLVQPPWLNNIVTRFGVLLDGEVVLGDRPPIISDTASLIIGSLVIFAATFGLATLVALYRNRVPGSDERLALFCWINVPFCVASLAILVLRFRLGPFDRYLLPVVAVSLIGFIAVGERVAPRRAAVLSWVAMLSLGIYGLAATHDAYREWEARAKVTNQLNRAGIPRQCILGGYEYDGWTEVEASGVFNPPETLPPRKMAVEFAFYRSTPSLTAKYYVVLSKQKQLAPSVIQDVRYTTWLSPRQRHVLVQEDPTESCLGFNSSSSR